MSFCSCSSIRSRRMVSPETPSTAASSEARKVGAAVSCEMMCLWRASFERRSPSSLRGRLSVVALVIRMPLQHRPRQDCAAAVGGNPSLSEVGCTHHLCGIFLKIWAGEMPAKCAGQQHFFYIYLKYLCLSLALRSRMTVALLSCDCGWLYSCGYSHIGPSCGGVIAADSFMRQRRRRRARDAKGNSGAERLRSECGVCDGREAARCGPAAPAFVRGGLGVVLSRAAAHGARRRRVDV